MQCGEHPPRGMPGQSGQPASRQTPLTTDPCEANGRGRWKNDRSASTARHARGTNSGQPLPRCLGSLGAARRPRRSASRRGSAGETGRRQKGTRPTRLSATDECLASSASNAGRQGVGPEMIYDSLFAPPGPYGLPYLRRPGDDDMGLDRERAAGLVAERLERLARLRQQPRIDLHTPIV